MRKWLKLAITVIAVAVLLEGCYLQQGGWMMINPKYDEAKLVGLSSAQIVQRLGRPSYDPRTPGIGTTQPSWTSEAADGPLVLGYHQNWATTRIEFKNDRVVSVQRYWK